MAEREINVRNKLVAKDIGNPKAILAMPKEGNFKNVLGIIMGIATGVKRRADKVDPTKMNEALIGTFEGTPSDAKEPIISSGVCYLPEGMFNLIASKLEGENAAENVQFAIEVATIHANNAAGYTWSFTPKLAVAQADPLAAMREQLKLAAPSVPEPAKADKKK